MTTTRQLISLLYSYSADTLTNIMSTYATFLSGQWNLIRFLVMALPIRLVWNLQMPRSKKIGVIGLFATGAVCIVMATVRVARITQNVYQYNMGIDGTWLAIWGMIECSIGEFTFSRNPAPNLCLANRFPSCDRRFRPLLRRTISHRSRQEIILQPSRLPETTGRPVRREERGWIRHGNHL